jgi:hypothetical protein
MDLAALIWKFFNPESTRRKSRAAKFLHVPNARNRYQSARLNKTACGSNLKTLAFGYSQTITPAGTAIALIHPDQEIKRRYSMSPAAETEFLRLLKKDISCFERIVEAFEELVPHLSAPIQDQWRLQAQSRRNFAMELMILLEKAESYTGSPAQESFRLPS